MDESQTGSFLQAVDWRAGTDDGPGPKPLTDRYFGLLLPGAPGFTVLFVWKPELLVSSCYLPGNQTPLDPCVHLSVDALL